MEFKDVVYGRRSVRKFKDTPVNDKILEEIVDAALWAPSGVNLQPWYYVVIRTPEKMTRLKEMMSVVSDRDRPHLEERFFCSPGSCKDDTFVHQYTWRGACGSTGFPGQAGLYMGPSG